ncbi:MAG: metallophosphoesterase, partial [Bacteroidales bacterium]
MKKIQLVIILLLATLCLNAQELVILHTNDTHSQITPQTTGAGKGLGGYERREQYINKVRAENKNVILLDAGDFSQGTPYFTIFKGDVE